jgi:hypothetical protein
MTVGGLGAGVKLEIECGWCQALKIHVTMARK